MNYYYMDKLAWNHYLLITGSMESAKIVQGRKELPKRRK